MAAPGVVLEFDDARVIVDVTRVPALRGPLKRVARAGQDVTVQFEPGPALTRIPTEWGGLHAFFSPAVAELSRAC